MKEKLTHHVMLKESLVQATLLNLGQYLYRPHMALEESDFKLSKL